MEPDINGNRFERNEVCPRLLQTARSFAFGTGRQATPLLLF